MTAPPMMLNADEGDDVGYRHADLLGIDRRQRAEGAVGEADRNAADAASGEMRQALGEVELTSSGGAGLVRSASETGTSDRVIIIDMIAKMVKPPAPKTGIRNCAPVTEPMSMMR